MSQFVDGTFTQGHRIKIYPEFQAVFKNGRFFYNEFIKMGALKNEKEICRLGLIVGKKHGSAPVRNRIKRLSREVYRLNKHRILVPCDILIIPSVRFKDWTYELLENSFVKLVKKINGSLGVHQDH